ncbi:MAG: PIN domain-containing protein [Deltaproteobacteria bacterium]|nr:PIN domain-containing protein [Deltaproteobacteria bacterium]
MSPIFLDSDIILDVFAKRHPFYEQAARVLTLAETQQIRGCTSSLIFANLYYILRRLKNREIAVSYLRKLQTLVEILAVDAHSIVFSLNSAFPDVEDAIQYFTAKQHHIAYLITRNIKDYKAAEKNVMRVCTAEEYLQLWDAAKATSLRRKKK